MGKAEKSFRRNKSGDKGKKEIVFDAGKRRDFVTGFRKRKNERKQIARRRIAEEVRQDKIQAREEKRDVLKATHGVGMSDNAADPDPDDDDNDDGDDDENPESVLSTFIFQDTITTTCVTPIDDSPSEPPAAAPVAGDRTERKTTASTSALPPKKKKFDLNLPLATAIPGFKNPKGLKKARKMKKVKRVVSKKEKQKTKAASRAR